MNSINKRDIEKCVQKVLQQKQIPGENKIRQIVREEIEGYYEKEENELKQSFSEKFRLFFHNKNLGWYMLFFFLTGIDVLGFSILVTCSQTIILNKINTKILIIFLVAILLGVLLVSALIWLSIKVYDKIIEKDYKNARLICLLEILYWCNVLMPDASSIIENIL